VWGSLTKLAKRASREGPVNVWLSRAGFHW
jgi:hypothetical protein